MCSLTVNYHVIRTLIILFLLFIFAQPGKMVLQNGRMAKCRSSFPRSLFLRLLSFLYGLNLSIFAFFFVSVPLAFALNSFIFPVSVPYFYNCLIVNKPLLLFKDFTITLLHLTYSARNLSLIAVNRPYIFLRIFQSSVISSFHQPS